MPLKRLKEIPRHQQPRERLAGHGPGYLTTDELYAILIGSGTVGHDVRAIAREVGRYRPGQADDYRNLLAIRGLGPAGACRLLAAWELARRRADREEAITLNQPEDVYRHLASLCNKQKEYLVGLYLDPRRRLIEEVTLAVGSLHALALEPYDVLHPAVLKYAPHFILAHNHPSGNPRPSRADRKLTATITDASALLGIRLLDHLILVEGACYSFARQRLLTMA